VCVCVRERGRDEKSVNKLALNFYHKEIYKFLRDKQKYF
jgi:rRNA processing protein Krr1/Pno1